MKSNVEFEQIIRHAVAGSEDCREQLVKLTTPRLRPYIYRSILDNHVTDDLLQEVYCKMFVSIKTLKDISSFWPWAYRLSSNCVKDYFRLRSKHRHVGTLEDVMLESIARHDHSAQAKLMTQELSKAVMKAVSALTPRHRQIITLRCFESMSFKDISKVHQISEVYARILFHRAIEKLRIALKKQGFRKASLVLALTMFGRLTAYSKAAALTTTVKTASIAAGAGKAALGAKVIKTAAAISAHQVKVAVTAVALASLVTTTATVGTFRSNVRSVHYVIQGVVPVVEKTAADNSPRKRQSYSSSSLPSHLSSYPSSMDMASITYETKGAYENKLFMPQGPDGPLLRHMQRWDTNRTAQLCAWLQDGSGNYYYHPQQDTIHITNDPLRMLILPTDDPEFVNFIFSQVGYDSRLNFKRKFLTGLVRYSVDNRVTEYPDYQCQYWYNSFDRSGLATGWPSAKIIEDHRDQMHKRGWTCFEITGFLNDHEVRGEGQIPFVYDMYHQQPPWLRLNVGNHLYIDHPGSIAAIQTPDDSIQLRSESLFTGLCRPWQGIPCIDSIRRDAAKYRLRFNSTETGPEAMVTILTDTDAGLLKIVYTLDCEKDIIRDIKFIRNNKLIGELLFNYLQQDYQLYDDRFQAPPTTPGLSSDNELNIFWLTIVAS